MESATRENPNLTLPKYLDGRGDAAEIRKLILKLRWIGHETEANRLCAALVTKAPDQIWPGEPMHTD